MDTFPATLLNRKTFQTHTQHTLLLQNFAAPPPVTPSLDQDLYLTLTPAQRGEARRIISVGETVHKFWLLNNIMMRINPTILSVSLSPSQRQGDN